MASDGYALPKPGVPKTLGILNVIFAVLLILFGLCTGFVLLIAPVALQIAQQTQQAKRAGLEAQRQEQLKTLDDRAKDAATDEEKATIAKEREAAATSSPVPDAPDMSTSLESMKDPRVMGFTITQILSGLVLHIILLVAGIGLIRLTPWGRTLGLWWAGLQIVQLVILGVVAVTVTMPIQRVSTAKQLIEMRKRAEAPNATPDAKMMLRVTEVTSKLAPVIFASYMVGAMVYPIISLILLRTPGARAACVGRGLNQPPTMGYNQARVIGGKWELGSEPTPPSPKD